MRALLIAPIFALAACQAAPIPKPVKTQSPREDASIVVLVSRTGQQARDLMHELAARCWLDGVVRGAQLIVKPGGNIEIVGDRELLVAADYIGLKGARSRWRLTGVSIRDPQQTRRLVQTLDHAVKTGDTFCPRLS